MVVWIPFTRGPEDAGDDPVVVSFTAFTPQRRRDVARIALRGLRLRLGWYAMPGAVGVWLWYEPLRFRGGSLTVWTSEDALRRFVGLPRHVATMREFGPRVRVDAATWRQERFAPGALRERAAAERISGPRRRRACPSARPSP